MGCFFLGLRQPVADVRLAFFSESMREACPCRWGCAAEDAIKPQPHKHGRGFLQGRHRFAFELSADKKDSPQTLQSRLN
jgi:hypothetical protein